MTFEEWMAQVDEELEGLCGMTTLDLPDQLYREWFEASYSPAQAAIKTMDNEGLF
jgi:hypothetical protein